MTTFSIGLVADCQYAEADPIVSPTMQRYFADSPRRLEAAVAEFDRHDLGFVAHLGDLIDHDLRQADRVLSILAAGRAPVRHVLGNHDFYRRTDGVTPTEDVVAAYGMPSRYYAFTHENWRFCVLDSNDVGVIRFAPGTPGFLEGQALIDALAAEGAVNARPWNGTLGPEQRAWLNSELDAANEAGQRVAVMCHHPLDDTLVDSMLRGDALAAELEGRVDVVLTGHHHAGSFRTAGSLPCLTLSGMVETTTSSFAILDAGDEELRVRGFGKEPDRIIPLTRSPA